MSEDASRHSAPPPQEEAARTITSSSSETMSSLSLLLNSPSRTTSLSHEALLLARQLIAKITADESAPLLDVVNPDVEESGTASSSFLVPYSSGASPPSPTNKKRHASSSSPSFFGLPLSASGPRIAPSVSVRALDVGNEDLEDWGDEDPDPHAPRQPRLSRMVLNRDGNFVSADYIVNRTTSSAPGTSWMSKESKLGAATTQKEDAIMDKIQRRGMSYVEISNSEKHAVFMLPAVRRSMRYLEHASILMSDEVLQLSNRYMEMGPSRASLMHIGYESLQTQCESASIFGEYEYISPTFRFICGVRGYHWAGYIIFFGAALCELAFFSIHIHRHGLDQVSGPATLMSLIFFVLNTKYSFTTTFLKHPLTHQVPIDDVRITGSCYLRLVGLDTLAKAQKKLREVANNMPSDTAGAPPRPKRPLEKVEDLSCFRKKIVNKCLQEALTVHCLIGYIPVLWSLITTAIRSHDRGDKLIAALCIVQIYSRTVQILSLAHVSFLVRLSQRLSEFEIRRTEADIRTCPPSLTHRITPRFKSMLHECHLVGNRAHSLFYFVFPILLCNSVQFLGAVITASFGDGRCVPAWIFFALFQPLVTLIVWIHNYGLLNLFIERDIDQDVVEMNIRLTYSDSHVPNWLLQQLICLERLDGRAFSLPSGLVPSIEMSRQLASSVLTGAVVLAPYLVSIFYKLSAEILCGMSSDNA